MGENHFQLIINTLYITLKNSFRIDKKMFGNIKKMLYISFIRLRDNKTKQKENE